MIDQYKIRIASLENDVAHLQKVQAHLTESIRKLQGKNESQNDEVKALKDTIKNSEGTDAANQMKVLTKEKEDLQELVRTLQGEKDDLQELVRSSEEKLQAEKSSNITLREHIKRFEEKYQAEERENDNLRDQRAPLKRRKSDKHSCNTRDSEGEKAVKSPKQRACSRSPSRRTPISRPQEADNTSDRSRRSRFRRLTGSEPEADWRGSR